MEKVNCTSYILNRPKTLIKVLGLSGVYKEHTLDMNKAFSGYRRWI